MRRTKLAAACLAYITCYLLEGSILPEEAKQVLAGEASVEAKAQALKVSTSIPQLIAFFSCKSEDRSLQIAALNVARELIKDKDARGRQAFIDFVYEKFYQFVPNEHLFQRMNIYLELLLASSDLGAIERFIEAHAERLTWSELNSVMHWITQQDPEWLSAKKHLISKVVGRIKPELFAVAPQRGFAHVRQWLNKYPFTEQEYSNAIVDTFLTSLEFPGLCGGLGDIAAALEILESRGNAVVNGTLPRLEKLLSSGRSSRAKLIVWQILATEYAEPQERNHLISVAEKHFPDLNAFVERLKHEPAENFVTRESPGYFGVLVEALRQERQALCIDPLLQEKMGD